MNWLSIEGQPPGERSITEGHVRQHREEDIGAQKLLYDADVTAGFHESWSAARVMFIGPRSALAGQSSPRKWKEVDLS